MAEHRQSGKLAVILHADVAGSTTLVQQDERLAHERIQETFHRFGDIIAQYHGRVRELRGDALLAEFERASDAVTAALAFQADQPGYTARFDDNILPTVRVGIAMGEVIIADNTVTGTGVVLAQRVEQMAEPGGVVIQGAAYETIPGRFPFEYGDLGEHEVKGFDKPVRAYSAGLRSNTTVPAPEPKREAESEQPDHRFRNTLVALASVAVVAIGVTLVWFKPGETREEPASVERMAFPLPDKPSIAVLPFNNMSNNEEQEYFVDGMTEDLITDLSQLSGLFVIARNSVFTYKDKAIKVRQVAEELGVRYVLEGSVRRAGDQVRINAQLIDATTGGHVWAKRYDGSLDDVFALQDQVTEKIVSALAVELTAEELSTQKTRTGNSKAYDEFLKGQKQYRVDTPKSHIAAAQHFKRAVELDPNYGRAYAALAAVYWNTARNGWSLKMGLTYNEASSQSREYLNEAMKWPSSLAHQVASERASNFRPKADRALKEAETAIDLDTNDPAGYLAMANALIKAKRPGEAIASVKQAMRLDPRYPASYLRLLGRTQLADRQFETAAATLELAVERNPQDEWAMVFLTAAYGHLDRKDRSAAIARKTDALRAELGKGALTLENVDVELYISRANYELSTYGMRGDREVLREGLLKAGVDRGFRWYPLVSSRTVTGSDVAPSDHAAYEVDGATNIDLETAKKLHERGVPFVETEPRRFQLHIPGAHLLNYVSGEFNERRLSQIVDMNSEVVISGWHEDNYSAYACAAAVFWGFRKVYCFPEGSEGWQLAGYPIEGVR